MAAAETVTNIPWWKEPTKDQWLAWVAAWLGWTLDAFDFTIFLLIMLPIAQEFDVPLTAVTIVFTLTLWIRLVGATAAGWLADRMVRKIPLMISIVWYSSCNFIAGFSPTFRFLLVFRTLLGNTLTACWWMASAFVTGYSILALFPTHLQKDLALSPGLVALPVLLQNLVFFLSSPLWGWVADRIGRRWAIIIPAVIAIPITPAYLLTSDYTMIVVFFALQGAFAAGGMHVQYPAYLAERFPTEVR